MNDCDERICQSVRPSVSLPRLNENIEFDIAAIKILFVRKVIESNERKSRKNYGVQSN